MGTQQHGPLRSYSFPSLSVTTFERPQHSHTPPVHLHFCECSLAFATEHFNICWATTLSPRPHASQEQKEGGAIRCCRRRRWSTRQAQQNRLRLLCHRLWQ